MKMKKNSPLLNAKHLKALLLTHKVSGIKKNMLIPDDLIVELEDFAERNSIVNSPSVTCCRCLKAHALKQAEKETLSKSTKDFLMQIFDCEEGHNGYYLDGGRLIKS